MEVKTHSSSVQVMFSDKGSTFLGVFAVFLMLALSLTLFFTKLQKKPLTVGTDSSPQKAWTHYKALKNSKILFYPLTSKHNILFHKIYSTSDKQATESNKLNPENL